MSEIDFSRNVYGILGVPIDIDTQVEVLQKIRDAVLSRKRFLISTVNLNFITLSQRDYQFRQSLHLSDLCTVDGMPVVWIAKALGVPLKERVAGSDLFESLKTSNLLGRPLNVALFGGPEGAALKAADQINSKKSNIQCVAAIFPGFGKSEAISSPEVIVEVNACEADLLSVSLGAEKGQAWLIKSDKDIRIPVRVHLGATVNFEAGAIARAPKIFRRLGFEWIWRIKEEPRLFKRYWNDGFNLLYLLVRSVLPLAVNLSWNTKRYQARGFHFRVVEDEKTVRVVFCGAAIDRFLREVPTALHSAMVPGKNLILDMSEVDTIDTRFMGMAVTVREQVLLSGRHFEIVAANRRVRNQLELNSFGFMLQGETVT